MQNPKFWRNLDRLVEEHEIEIDRPKGSVHPKQNVVYPVDYGFLAGTRSPDNAGIDIYVGSMESKGVTAVICTVDTYKKDSEIKILLGCTAREEEEVFRIYSQLFETLQGILFRRE